MVDIFLKKMFDSDLEDYYRKLLLNLNYTKPVNLNEALALHACSTGDANGHTFADEIPKTTEGFLHFLHFFRFDFFDFLIYLHFFL